LEKKMLRLFLFSLLAAGSFAQDASEVFNKPPARVDQALRERITQFYQFHVNKDFRKAEALVAPDTKDYFYSHNKPAYLSCETVKIAYTDNFKKAKATMLCSQYIMVPGFEDKPMKVPFGSTWKIVAGKWVWYVDQEVLKETPFGKMVPGAPGLPPGIPAGGISRDTDFVPKLVSADKDTVTLHAGQSEAVTFKNAAPGIMDVSIVGTIPGIEAKFDNANMKIGGQSILTVKAGDGAKSGLLNIKVEQTGMFLPVQVIVQ
jgi:hypothetical protein